MVSIHKWFETATKDVEPAKWIVLSETVVKGRTTHLSTTRIALLMISTDCSSSTVLGCRQKHGLHVCPRQSKWVSQYLLLCLRNDSDHWFLNEHFSSASFPEIVFHGLDICHLSIRSFCVWHSYHVRNQKVWQSNLAVQFPMSSKCPVYYWQPAERNIVLTFLPLQSIDLQNWVCIIWRGNKI